MASEVGPVWLGSVPQLTTGMQKAGCPDTVLPLNTDSPDVQREASLRLQQDSGGKKQQILQLFSLAFHPSVAPLETQDAMTTQKPTWHFWHLPDGEGHLPGKVTTPRTRSCK